MTISERIFQLIDDRHLSVKEFSRLTGISYSTIIDWKRKNTNPAADKIMTICQVLTVTPEYLLLGDTVADQSSDSAADFDFSIDTQELRIITAYRSLNGDSKKLFWAYLEALSKLNYSSISDAPSS